MNTRYHPLQIAPQTMVNLEKIYGKACGNMFMLW